MDLSGAMRLFLLGIASLAATATMLACVPRDSSGGSSATPTNSARGVEPAPIDALDILTRESAPPGYSAKIVSGLPSGCARFNEAKITNRSGNAITIAVTNTTPTDTNTACTAIYGQHESFVDLGTTFTPGQTYTVVVGDKQARFTAQ